MLCIIVEQLWRHPALSPANCARLLSEGLRVLSDQSRQSKIAKPRQSVVGYENIGLQPFRVSIITQVSQAYAFDIPVHNWRIVPMHCRS